LIVGQNLLFFDVYQVANFQRYLGEKIDYSYINRVYDTLALGRANLLGVKFPDGGDEITPWMYRFCGFFQKGLKASLGALCKQFDIVYDDTKVHEGLKDVLLTDEVFKKLYWQLEVWN
jgi:DNA polymerase III epsilon subunit-like protein